jgi:processing peptidase subunit beta
MAGWSLSTVVDKAAPEAIRLGSKYVQQALSRIPQTAVTQLPNGFRIASEWRPGRTATVGVWIDSGSRWETKENNGVAHFLEHMTFKGTSRRSRQDIELAFEKTGGHLNAYTSREHTVYYAKCLQENVGASVDVLADILLNSTFSDADVEAERHTILTEMREVEEKVDEVVMDKLHEAAFETDGLGLTILGPEANINGGITADTIRQYISTHYTGPRMTLVGTGAVDHSALEALGEKLFGGVPSGPPKPVANARFIGGDIRVHNFDIPYCHFAIGWATPGASSGASVALQILGQVHGTWNQNAGPFTSYMSFKGAIHNDALVSNQTFVLPFSDVGLIGSYVVTQGVDPAPENVLRTVMGEWVRSSQKLSADEVERAKAQLKVQILQENDGTSNLADTIGKQLMWNGRRVTIAEMFDRIDACSLNDVMEVAERVVYDKDPIVSVLGPAHMIPDYNLLRSLTWWRRH